MRKRILQTFHFYGMHNACELIVRCAAHTVRRRIGSQQIGVRLFNRLQFPHQHIIFVVFNIVFVFHIIAVDVVIQFFAQCFGTQSGVFIFQHIGTPKEILCIIVSQKFIFTIPMCI